LTQGAITLHKALTEERQKRMLRRAFQYYLHPTVVEQVSQHPELLRLGGEAKDLTVMFSDIRGFSGIAEQLRPEALVQLLNEYLTAMTQLILDDQGLVDKYIGDAIMAVYGAPLSMPDHAYRACHTAVHMMTTLQGLQERWGAQGLPRIDIGIGINTGEMVVGNMGSALRFNYTVMGDAVNLASRLEGANKTYGTRIIISDSTWEQVCDRLATRELDVIQVKGKATPTRIFEVLGFPPLPAAQARLVQDFESGMRAYRARRWDEALSLFQQTLQYVPADMPSQLYIQRCMTFKEMPPPQEWDGVYIMQTK
jgi:adenylate cyclase